MSVEVDTITRLLAIRWDRGVGFETMVTETDLEMVDMVVEIELLERDTTMVTNDRNSH